MQFRDPTFRRRLALMGAILCMLAANTAQAQVEQIEVKIDAEDIGLRGYVRPGTWIPLRLTLVNNATTNTPDLRCELVYADIDGDTVAMHRSISIGAKDTRSLWLYGCPPINTPLQDANWRVRVLNGATGEIIAMRRIVAPKPVHVYRRVVGITSARTLGLEQYRNLNTQHEALQVIDDLKSPRLPDRWYGLSLMESLVWTSGGGDPGAKGVPIDAIREWVRRGGHLVIASGGADTFFEQWQKSSLADLLPPVRTEDAADLARREPTNAPGWLGVPIPRMPRVVVRPLHPMPAPPDELGKAAQVLLYDDDGKLPLVVSHQVGIGRVTVVGVDLADENLADNNLPNGPRLWRALFGWQSPAIPESVYKARMEAGQYTDPTSTLARRNDLIDGQMIGLSTDMRETAAPALWLAVFLFLGYWLFAGPVSYLALKSQKRVHLSWAVFALIVLGFTVVAWGGAFMLRPRTTRIAHFSVVTIDTQSGTVHTHSWMSLFMARHGRAQVAVDPARTQDNVNTITSAGFSRTAPRREFADRQTYALDAAAPSSASIPMRSTAKQLEIDYLGQRSDIGGAAGKWSGVGGEVEFKDGKLSGKLTHSLPGAIEDLIVIYTPGGDALQPGADLTPRVWYPRQDTWVSGDLFDVSARLGPAMSMLQRPKPVADADDPPQRWRGYLGELIAVRSSMGSQAADATNVSISEAARKRRIEMLMFYSFFPPPDYFARDTGFNLSMSQAYMYKRSVGRQLDMTHLLVHRRMIFIGYVNTTTALPLPIAVDGEPVTQFDRKSRTLVRLIVPVKVK